MINVMIFTSLILIICIVSTKVLHKFSMPVLLIFIVLGMLFGSDGVVGIHFSDYNLASNICSIALIFIMFYGGFGTKWSKVKTVAVKSILMSTIGVAITSGLTGLFCSILFKITLLEGLLIGAIIGSTDAASVFCILRSQNLNLKGCIDDILALESGSNDPTAYMLTMVILGLMNSNGQPNILIILLNQVLVAIIISVLLAKLTIIISRNTKFEIEGLYPLLITAVAILSYALTEYLGGNGYLSTYIIGLMIGNGKIPNKTSIYQFFDGISWLMQILLFFLLGLLAFPSKIPGIAIKGVTISLFLMFIARPIATFSILSWFKVPYKQQLFISFVGIRGAASIVFAIYAVIQKASITTDIFHIIFFIALFSVSVQGSFISTLARKLDLIDDNESVFETFNDYPDSDSRELIKHEVSKNSSIANKKVKDINLVKDGILVGIERDNETITPYNSTIISPEDKLILSINEPPRSKQ